MRVIDLTDSKTVQQLTKKPHLSQEEKVIQQVEQAKAQIVKDQAAYEALFQTFYEGIKELPTYATFLNSIKSASHDMPNQIIEVLLKQSKRDAPPEAKRIRAEIFADIIAKMEKR